MPLGASLELIVLTFSDHYVKGKVFSPVVGGAPELLAALSVLCRAFPQKQGAHNSQVFTSTRKGF